MNKTQLTFLSLVFSTVFLVSACDDDDFVNSDKVPTTDMDTFIEIYSFGGEELTAHAQLTGIRIEDDDDNIIRLTSGDELWISSEENIDDIKLEDDLFSQLAELDQKHMQLLRTDDGLDARQNTLIDDWRVWYSTDLLQSEAGIYNVGFFRNIRGSAPDSFVQMPAPFDLNLPVANTEFSRSTDAIILQWTGMESGVTVEVDVETECPPGDRAYYSADGYDDNGEIVISAGTLVSDDLTGSCNTLIRVIKTRIGALDNLFNGGQISAHQVREVTILTVD